MKKIPLIQWLGVLMTLIVLFYLPQYTVLAADMTVTIDDSSRADDGNCSLREAVANANSNTQLFTSVGECPAGSNAVTDTITLTMDVCLTETDSYGEGKNGLPSIRGALVVEGNNYTITRKGPCETWDEFRFFHIDRDGDLTLNNVTLQGGVGEIGGAISNQGMLTLNQSILQSNTAWQSGGGFVNYEFATVNIHDSIIRENYAQSNRGGGFFNYEGVMHIVGSEITANGAGWGGGFESNGQGSAITVDRTLIRGNVANGYGGGFNLETYGNATFTNTIVSGNRSLENGGGGAVGSSNAIQATFINTTFAGNSANLQGGGLYNRSASTRIHNSVFWGNQSHEIFSTSSAARISYSAVEGGLSGINITNAGNNLTLNSSGSEFVDAKSADTFLTPNIDGDYHLNSGNALYNAGINGVIPSGILLDIDDEGRIQGGTVDIGADEIVIPIELSASGTGVTEGDSGTVALLFNFSLNFPSLSSVTVDVATQDGTASSATDYVPVTATVTIPAGSTHTTFAVDVNGDIKTEGDETVVLNVSNASNAILAVSQTISTIQDDDSLPPIDTNLIYNPDFSIGSNGSAGWTPTGSIIHNLTYGVMNLHFPSAVSGWLRQFRALYPLESGLPMVAWVNVSNPDPVTKTFQLMMRDSDMTNSFMCSFEVPPNAPLFPYYMYFYPMTDWEIVEIDIRPTVVDTNGLNFDDVNLRYRPYLTITEKECIAPNFSDEDLTEPAQLSDGGDTDCSVIDWFDTANWKGYLPTSEVQFIFDPFPETLLVGTHNGASVYDANGDGVADTLYDALSYNPPSVYGGNEGGSASATLIREAVIAMLNDRYDSNHPESWWAVEIDTAEALANGENDMLALAQQYALSNASCQ